MSAAPKRGLGRGLGALLGETGTSDVTTPGANASAKREMPQIPLAKIRPNPHQPRTTFSAEALDELRDSIATFGVLVPIIVRERGDGYELIAGERRWRAAQAAGLQMIPAIVRAADDRESLEVAIIENLQRENLDPLEEAMGFAHLMEAYDFTQEVVAQRVGRSRSAIANALRLLSLPDAVKALVREGRLSAGHARAILALPPERRESTARRAVEDGLSVRALERLAQDSVPKRARTASATRPSSVDDEFVERLRYRYATHVRVVPQERGGTIELRYSDPADLLRIVDLLLGESA
ncbi:MAG TPA: ParB/RepB/Spo0J family partition protein [Candidatus Acidoferrum sp.]|nr:ParB/RepB/Spo0J family partition protein [Candidatus Acidoferrum sp.]